MKIGIVCYPTYGGSGIVATQLGMEMASQGDEAHFISYSLPAKLDITLPNIYFHQVNVKPYPLFEYQPFSLALSTTIVNIVETYKLDLLHVHYAIPHAYAAYFAKQILKEKGIELPVITTLHGTDITLVGQHPIYKSAVEFSINQSDYITSVSDSLRKETYHQFNIHKEIEVIPNFINNAEINENSHCLKKNFVSNDEKLLVHVSNLRKVKRIDDVMKIFNLVQKEVKSKLLIVGEGPEAETIDRYTYKFKLGEKVKNFGKIQDVQNVLRITDLFLLPSEQESFGLAALEAMACGVPVISSNAGGITEVNKDGYSGFVSPIGDVESMAKNAIRLLKDEDLLLKFKKQAKNEALLFDNSKIIPKYKELYNRALNQKLKSNI
ncbi:N-acetyl-alpha-D-glucosaminyl L-malate synthase BshA [Apibacter muscae]|uniref:N-acetyl-alpha-D-glucosaminyl L-malate synthase BshA n=1 Tax=Apibacter muscae TaxID=2509004 RepID=A0A563DEX6_9FLAO|nr:N-acetyl-alpha-D-glucosaminyl L-malate synthase BshA [Apibacter muscae]TWP28775.1 N-acetyl-alpha-D-glucosaminyl L-malate synthase BshA [Apibacter muscae]